MEDSHHNHTQKDATSRAFNQLLPSFRMVAPMMLVPLWLKIFVCNPSHFLPLKASLASVPFGTYIIYDSMLTPIVILCCSQVHKGVSDSLLTVISGDILL